MPRYTSRLTSGQRSAYNAVVGTYGGLSTEDRTRLGYLMNLAPRTVDGWFRNEPRRGRILLTSHVNLAMCELQHPDAAPADREQYRSQDPFRDRMNLAMVLQGDGVVRDALYTGKPHTWRGGFDNIAQAVRWLSQFLCGDFDKGYGYRWSVSWTRLRLVRGGEFNWTIIVSYNEWNNDGQDGSDPDEQCPEGEEE